MFLLYFIENRNCNQKSLIRYTIFKPNINGVVTLYRNDEDDKIADSSRYCGLNMSGNITLIGSERLVGDAIIGNGPHTTMN